MQWLQEQTPRFISENITAVPQSAFRRRQLCRTTCRSVLYGSLERVGGVLLPCLAFFLSLSIFRGFLCRLQVGNSSAPSNVIKGLDVSLQKSARSTPDWEPTVDYMHTPIWMLDHFPVVHTCVRNVHLAGVGHGVVVAIDSRVEGSHHQPCPNQLPGTTVQPLQKLHGINLLRTIVTTKSNTYICMYEQHSTQRRERTPQPATHVRNQRPNYRWPSHEEFDGVLLPKTAMPPRYLPRYLGKNNPPRRQKLQAPGLQTVVFGGSTPRGGMGEGKWGWSNS